MHLEILVEDASGKIALEVLVPKVLGVWGVLHTWRVHAYKGVGRIPKNLQGNADPSKRMLLNPIASSIGRLCQHTWHRRGNGRTRQ